MNMPGPAGFRERAHTADWELEVWAPDLLSLLEQAARGMYTLMGTSLRPAERIVREVELPARDPESMLVDFLTELLYLAEVEGLGVANYHLQIEGEKLLAQVESAPIASLAKEIKAVTYHKLAIRQTERGLEANIVFDV
jgi:SHS2 domain-containing protein